MRQIYEITATQVVVSEAHPEGAHSVVNGFPIRRDSRDYERTEANPNGNGDLALTVAKADFADIVKQLSIAHNRVMWTVTLTRADGRQIMRESRGSFPDMTPQPEPVEEVTEDEMTEEEATDESQS